MKILNQKDLQIILMGSTIYGCGGGGRYNDAYNLLKDVKKPITLLLPDELPKNSIICTGFGAGGLTTSGNPKQTMINNFINLQKILPSPIRALIPVEIGPMSLAYIFLMASYYSLPIIDGDYVGGRASPDIDIELVTMYNKNRCPSVVSNSNGESLTIMSLNNPLRFESTVRNFSTNGKSKAYVLGYPFTPPAVKQIYSKQSITKTLQTGTCLKNQIIQKIPDINIIDTGTISSQKTTTRNGFTYGTYTIKSKAATYAVWYKNENLRIAKNNIVLTEVPTCITLINTKSYIGLNNGDENDKKSVMIVSLLSDKRWYTKKGKSIFFADRFKQYYL